MKLAVVVQRYGADINGGAEQHARFIAERIARHHEVEVLTTCAEDYVTWRNVLPPGAETVHGLTVRRFPVVRERVPEEFAQLSHRVFEREHSIGDELAWLDSEGPTAPALIEHVREHERDYDFFLFFSFRYYHAFHGVRAVTGRAVLVPTAERDAAVGLRIFGPVFRGVRAVMYNSFEERRMIQAVSGNREVPGVVVGVGSDVPERTDPERFRKTYGIKGPFLIYVGRIDANKGCAELFDFFEGFLRARRSALSLVLVGKPWLPIPDHPRIRHLGFLPDRDKFDAMAAADALIMPSHYESLSMVALEAWALGRPVLANGRCEVLRGQCIRSNAGLYYETFPEFAEALSFLELNGGVRHALGLHGAEYFGRHYAWPVIERKYRDMLDQLDRANREGAVHYGIEPLPGWLARRRRRLPAASGVVAKLPAGPVIPARRRRYPAPQPADS